MNGWEVVIGMEVHVQLRTRTKMFCRCPADYLGSPPNSHVCEVCLGMPGVLPVINRTAVEQCLKAALALDCQVAEWTKFDRKNYFYPDLPKGYQISQYDLPMSLGGRLELDGRTVRITRVHLEEDTGKSLHAGDSLHGAERSFVDLNRAGIPLMEVVSEPDLRSSEEARNYALALRGLMRAIGASDADMEKGQLRAEANVSVRREGETELGVKTELKNINSFRALKLAIDHEVARQIEVLEGGGAVVQETRGWNDARGITYSQRSKEFAQDYRYFPEPDLPPLEISREWLDSLRAALPELPAAQRARFEGEGVSSGNAAVVVANQLGDYLDAIVRQGVGYASAANWIVGEISPHIGDREVLAPEHVAAVVKLVESRRLNRDQGKQVLRDAWESGRDPEEIVRERGLEQVSDASQLDEWVQAAIAAKPQAAADYRAGNERALGALVGEVMKLSRGSADAAQVNELLRQRLS